VKCPRRSETTLGWTQGSCLSPALIGRRPAEVFRFARGDLSFDSDTCLYSYRGKGGKSGCRELPRPALARSEPRSWPSAGNLEPCPEEPLWPSRGHTDGPVFQEGRAAAYWVHVFRHAAAKLRRDAGESIEDVSRFLDHSSLAVTTMYLRRLEGQEDKGWDGWRRRSGCEGAVLDARPCSSSDPSCILPGANA